MKRLKNKLLAMENDTKTYKEMYDGSMYIIPPSGDSYSDNSACYYYGDDIGFTFSVSNKLAQDKPTVEISVPAEMLGISEYSVAAADHCLREFKPYIDVLNEALYNKSRPDNENGRYYLCEAGGEVLVRNTAYFAMCLQKDYWYHSGSTVVLFDDGKARPARMCLCLRIQVQLPQRKLRRTVQMLCRDLPDAVERFVVDFDTLKLEKALELSKKQAEIRKWLEKSEYCAFIANGSILPRSKGTQLPMENAVPFKSPKADEITVCGVCGMGIKRGVTVITGGGYSGKSTLLDAISAGIYDHAAGDGRELCITDESAVTIAAEDGRSVKHANISPFIKWLPGGDTRDFSTDHASGSTSQAANIMEAVDVGAKLLLIDEDRSATNFMIRDAMMKELIEKEPITPFTDRVNELWQRCGVSSILVIGGSGEYLSVADRIYMMDDFLVHDVTERARGICTARGICAELPAGADWAQERRFFAEGFTSYPERSGSEKLEVYDLGFIFIGDEKIDIRGLNDVITSRQLFALGFMLRALEISNKQHEIDLRRAVDELYDKIEREGLDIVFSAYFTTCERFLDLPRKTELLAVINRMRKVNFAK
ncbi:MAG: ABC-ATPase domain-containing protein [Clostridia bacterium]|nr:ABC-ATPase domain-containing protein [Clostridia bacterium]